jgi:exopolyphosphatase/guanosine-5'-triphosphate,3'-diphosphate pyrophosphatase
LTAVTTEGVRMARNQAAFLEPAGELLGQPVRLLSGDEEAELSYLSVAHETPEGGPLRVLDIGGGSTELVVGEGLTVLSAKSYPVGSVRLTERLIRSDPPTPEMLAAAHSWALTAFRAGPPVAPHPVLHGLAGTVTTVAALLLELPSYDRMRVDGSRFTVGQVQALRDALAAETLDQRCQRSCLERGRADVIVAGVTILLAALEHCGAEILVVRDRGLRYALV